MYKNIIVPIAPDHGGMTEEAIGIAHKLRDAGGTITLLSVTEPIPAFVSQYLPEGQLDTNKKIIAETLAKDAAGAESVLTEVVTGNAGVTIVEYASDKGADLIVIASHRPGLQDYFLGSTAARVVRHATCAVHVVR